MAPKTQALNHSNMLTSSATINCQMYDSDNQNNQISENVHNTCKSEITDETKILEAPYLQLF